MKFLSKHPRKPSVYQHEFHILRIWALTLGIFFVGFIISVAVHIYIFIQVGEGRLFGLDTIEEQDSGVVSAALINDVAGTLKERSAEFAGVDAERMPVDPS